MDETLIDRLVRRYSRLTIAGAATGLHALLYGIANRFPVFTPAQLPLSFLDRAVPLIPETAWIYWSDYLLVFVAFRRTQAPQRFIKAFVVTLVTAVGIHALFPTTYPRELFELTDASSFTGRLLVWFRGVDEATSCFPSLHVAVATLAAMSVRHTKGGGLLAAWSALIAVATLTTKQHYAYDVLGGAVLGAAAWALSAHPVFTPRRSHEPSPHPS